MSKDESTKTNIETSEIKEAISQLKELGWDINPFTISEHIGCSKELLYRDKSAMELVLEARGGDFTFKDPDQKLVDLEKTVEELEKENNNLATKLSELENADEENLPPEAINDQVMQLLQSQSQEEIKSLEEELSQAYEQAGLKQEEINDLTRTVSGLERVNEAINLRMRELEEKVAVLEDKDDSTEEKKESDDSEELKEKLQDLQRTVSGLERVNEAINLRMRELEDENKALKSDERLQSGTENDDSSNRVKMLEEENGKLLNALKEEQNKLSKLSDDNLNLKDEIKELNVKLTELHNDADNMAAQLQNAWHGGYEKGLAKAQAGPSSEPIGSLTEKNEDTTETPAPEATPQNSSLSSGSEDSNVETHELQKDDSAVINFTQAGPYVSSSFNPLEELSWKDLETVYSMGVLSVTDINPDTPPADTEQYVKLDSPEPKEDKSTSSENEATAQPEEVETTASPSEAQDDAEDPASMIPDFDQLDIFEDIEELEELGKIQVPDDMLADVPVDEFVKEEKATGDDLRDLINSRIKQAKEQGVEHTVRTPPAPHDDADGDEAKGFLGKNKFVGQNAKPNEPGGTTSSPPNVALKAAPREIRKACSILGISPEDLTSEKVNKAWKDLIASPGVHPDQGGDTEAAVILNSAKDQLLRFLESSAPKLGKKFGSGAPKDMSSRFTGKKKQ